MASVPVMRLRPSVIELVVSDIAATLASYRLLGLDLPPSADAEPHVEVDLGGGLRLAFDSVATVRSFDPGWEPPSGGHRVALGFECADAAEVDSAYAAVTAAGHAGHLPPWDAF